MTRPAELPWSGTGSDVCRHVRELSQSCLDAYRVNPLLIDEHANIERATAQGGYGRRQIYELVQNGADALIGYDRGKIHVLLTPSFLYCANEGFPIDLKGVDAILSSHLSVKRGNEIGRFGLGFKSVLGVTDKPQFISRSGSFSFNATMSAQRIRQLKPDAERVPTLRLASPLDAEVVARTDPHLTELMSWATTVVRLPLQPAESGWLAADLANFPAEFLLFSPHVGQLILENSVTGEIRKMELAPFAGDRFLLTEGGRDSVWRIFSHSHRPTPLARKDAGELADRESLPIVWAVPVGGRQARGHFWAFFPTDYLTTLSGIVNAPWKTNEDRLNLLSGAFNEELIDVVAELVVRSLPTLVDPQDPGGILDLLPARGREAPNWADATLTERIYSRAAGGACVPDQLGVLLAPAALQVHPQGTPRVALDLWAQVSGRPTNWCHASVETRERRARVDRLLGSGRQATYAEWLEALVTDVTPASSAGALHVARVADEHIDESRRADLRSARIVMTEAGDLAPATVGAVFVGERSPDADVTYVHADVQANREAMAALAHFGVRQVDPLGELQALIARRGNGHMDWDRFWQVSRRGEPSHVHEALADAGLGVAAAAKNLAGEFVALRNLLLPGPIVPSDGTRDAATAIDTEFHARDLPLLQLLGATPAPKSDGGSADEPWFATYRFVATEKYLRDAGALGQRPVRDFIEFDEETFVGPLSPLIALSDEGRVKFTEAVLAAETDFSPWTLAHRTQRERYPQLKFTHPAIWYLHTHGLILTSLGPRSVEDSVSPALGRWERFLPVARISPAVDRVLALPAHLAAVSQASWQGGLAAAEVVRDEAELGAFYAAMRAYMPCPERIWARVGLEFRSLEPELVTVAASASHLQALIDQSVPLVFVGDIGEADVLCDEWHLRTAESVIRTQIDAIPVADPAPIIDEFPALQWHLPAERRDLELIRCELIRQEVLTAHGKSATPVAFAIDGNRVFWNQSGNDRDLLTHLVRDLALQLVATDVDDILANKADKSRRELLLRIRKETDLASKFLAAVPEDAIRRRLPSSLVEASERLRGPASVTDLGRLAHAVYGVDLLHEFRVELEERGLQPPQHWAGSRAARSFVRALGFPNEYAGFEQARRAPLIEIDGPPNLPPLHDFQARITRRIKELLAFTGSRRGLLSLPTGAGKTRVAVQALTEALRDGQLDGPVLWVAETEELCEQAVQAWSEVWRSFGPGRPLQVSRLWAANEAEDMGAATHVVVATDAKLAGCIDDDNYGWLSRAKCVVVDEAHRSISPSYTKLLEWLGLGRSRQEDRCPLIGLTATPFRGTSEDETQRLVRRYNETRLDAGAIEGDQYDGLQAMGVLARVRHQLLAGARIELTGDELVQLKQTRRLSARAEAAVGANAERNETILKSIRSLPEAWTILLFAASVEHAEVLAALLSVDGISAAVISANTDPGARRHYIKEFRAGRLRVLTNYGVLTEGFDAPAVRAVYVTRPTFSPNVYQQMVGRGLRGPLNGGKEECLIVNVEDNVLMYGERLAFTQFDYLWAANG